MVFILRQPVVVFISSTQTFSLIMTSLRVLLVLFFILMKEFSGDNTRSIQMFLHSNLIFQCSQTTCLPFFNYTISDRIQCQIACLALSQCNVATYYQSTMNCQLFDDTLNQTENMSYYMDAITMIVIPETRFPPVLSYGINLVVNGDAETGNCSRDSNGPLPTAWTAFSPIIQISYNNTVNAPNYNTPGPSNRGKCFFYGGNGPGSNMSQFINVTAYAYDIDRSNTLYNFSAWLGGYSDQNDTASITLIFRNSSSTTNGTQVKIGPIYAFERNSVTKFLFRQQSGLVPPNTRYLTVLLTTFRSYGSCDAYADNIAVIFNHI